MDRMITLDSFPSIFAFPDGRRIEPARVIIENDTLHAFVDQHGEIEELVNSPVLSTEGVIASGMAIQTEEGMYVVGRASGCGCGNRLKGWTPFPADRYLRVGS